MIQRDQPSRIFGTQPPQRENDSRISQPPKQTVYHAVDRLPPQFERQNQSDADERKAKQPPVATVDCVAKYKNSDQKDPNRSCVLQPDRVRRSRLRHRSQISDAHRREDQRCRDKLNRPTRSSDQREQN